jgi:Helicase conserved C-terminal domain
MKTFMQVLTDDTFLSDEDFSAILHLWGMNEEEKNNTQMYAPEELLVQRAYEPISARFVWEYLKADEREVLYAILKNDEGKGIERSKLQQLVTLPEERFDTALTQLIKYALIPAEQTRMGAKKGVKQERIRVIYAFSGVTNTLYSVGEELFRTEADRSTKPLAELLLSYTPAQLYQMLKENGVIVPVAQPKVLSQRLAEVLKAKEDQLNKVHLLLDPSILQLYNNLRLRGGRIPMREVRVLMQLSDPSLRKVLLALEKNALAFDTFSNGERILFVPKDVFVKQEMIPEREIKMSIIEPKLVRAGETTTLFDIAMLIGIICQQRIELTQSRTIMKRYVPKLRQALRGLPRQSYYDDDNYPSLLFRAMGYLQLVAIDGSPEQGIKDHFEPGPSLADWGKKDLTQQMRDFLHLWEEGNYWVDMAGDNYQMDGYYYPNSTKGRLVLLKHLRALEKERWYEVEEFLDRIWEQDPTAMQQITTLSKKERLKNSASYIKWRNRDGELYIGSLGSTLNEVGLVDLGYADLESLRVTEYHNPSHFMISDLGMKVLRAQVNENQQGMQKALLVQPNFELLLLQPDFPTLYQLLPFAQVDQVGLASKLTLSQSSLLKGLESGYKVEQIIGFLSEHSQKELPQNIVYSIRDWAKNYREITISQILLLEVSDEAAARALCSSSKLKKFGFRQLGNTAVVTESDVDISELRRALEKEGIVVHVKGNIASQKQIASATSYSNRFR